MRSMRPGPLKQCRILQAMCCTLDASPGNASREQVNGGSPSVMIIRTTKLLLVCALALFHTLVVFDNVTDFGSNYQFVRHVLLMDTTFASSNAHWRAIAAPAFHVAFYVGIIVWEAAIAVLLWWGSAKLARNLRGRIASFHAAKRMAFAGLALSLLLWLGAFLSIGGEWFLMWQSPAWNGQQEAFRMFAVVALVFLILLHADADAQS
jgi:predicted small integral membrane protein